MKRLPERIQGAVTRAADVVLPWLGHALMRVLGAAVTIIVAIVLLFEEWGWQPLHRAFAALSRFRPIAALESMIRQLPPYGALMVFAAPVALLLPVKLGALYLLALGHAVLAIVLLVAAKIVGTGIVARIFILTQPQLMRIHWFAALYARFMPWKEALFERVRSSWAWRWGRVIKTMARRRIERVWARLKPQM